MAMTPHERSQEALDTITRLLRTHGVYSFLEMVSVCVEQNAAPEGGEGATQETMRCYVAMNCLENTLEAIESV